MVHLNNDGNKFVVRERSEKEWLLAKQRASVRWLVSKAYNNKVPGNLEDPYYRDQTDGSERLKPQVVHALANAELYCSCLANIYADPNYHNLSHWGVIQALARKGVYVAEPSDVALTETVLIQTGPIKMSAHMAVIEAIMALYIKEVITAERVVGVVRRFTSLQPSTELPADQEEALLLWINKACARLRTQISAECRANPEEGGVPSFPLLQDLSDLSDGTCLAGLVSLYCPDELSWPQIAFSDPPRIADSLYNLQLVEKFCREALPYNPHHLTLEDVLYMHSSVKQNLLVLLADLFYLFEISPAKCVRPPSLPKDRVIEVRRQESFTNSPRRSQPELRGSVSQADSFSAAGRDSPRQDQPSGGGSRRPQSMYPTDDRSSGREDDRSNSEESEFVVQRSQGPMTLSRLIQQRRSQSPPSSVQSDEALYPSSRRLKERLNRDTKWEERGEERRAAMSECGDTERYRVYDPRESQPRPAAGKPSTGGGGGGRLSRRNSFSEESQLTVENFGGSQDNLQLLGRNPDKQPVVHRGRRESSTHRDLLKESNISFGDRDPFKDIEQERALSRSASRQELYERSSSALDQPLRPPSRNLFQESTIKDHFSQEPPDPPPSRADKFVPIRRDSEDNYVEIDNRVLEALEREARSESPNKNNLLIMMDTNENGEDRDRPTSFAELSKVQRENAGGINIVYMQQDRAQPGASRRDQPGGNTTTTWIQQQQQQRQNNGPPDGGVPPPDVMASELHNIKLRLEEKRRNIEKEKRRVETAMSRQKQKLGKQAFLQAMGQEMSQNLSQLRDKWSRVPDLTSSPDLDNMDYDQYTSSLQHMNESLTELQDDIQRLSQQQSQMQQMQNLMQNGAAPAQVPYQPGYQAPPPPPVAPPGGQYGMYGQFYLHDQPAGPGPGAQRRQWGQPVAADDIYQQMSPGRARWGQPVRPMMPPHQQPQPYGAPPQVSYYEPTRPFVLHQDPGTGYPVYQSSPQHHHHMGGMMAPHQVPVSMSQPGRYQDPYGGGGGGYPDRQPPPVSQGGGGFRLHGETEPRELRAGQSPRMYTDFRLEREPEPGGRGTPRVPTVLRSGSGGSRRQRSPSPRSVLHAPMPAPPLDDMEPQHVSFIGEQSSPEPTQPAAGSRTYRLSRPPQRDEPDRQRSPAAPAHTSPTRAGGRATGRTFKVNRRTPSPQGRESPARGEEQPPTEDEISPEVAAAMKVNKIREDTDPELGFVISFDDNAGPRKPKPKLGSRRTPNKAGSSSSLLSDGVRKPEVPPKPKGLSVGAPSAFSTYTKPGREQPRAAEVRASSPEEAPDSGGFSLSRLSDPKKRTPLPPTPPPDAADPHSNGHGGDNPLIQKLELDPDAPLDQMRPLRTETAGSAVGLVIGDELVSPKTDALYEMEKKKEKILMMSLKRKQEQEAARRKKEEEALKKKEEEARKEEEKQRKKEEEKARKERIFEQYKLKKAIEEAEKNGTAPPQMASKTSSPAVRPRPKSSTPSKPRPKSMMEGAGGGPLTPSRGGRGSSSNLQAMSDKERAGDRWGSTSSLTGTGPRSRRGSNASLYGESRYSRPGTAHTGRKTSANEGAAGSATLRKDAHRTSTGSLSSTGRPRTRLGPRSGSSSSLYDTDGGYRNSQFAHSGRRISAGARPRDESGRAPSVGPDLNRTYSKAATGAGRRQHRSLLNLFGNDGGTPRYSETDSGLGRDTPTRRGVSPGVYSRGVTSPSGPGSLPPGLVSRRRNYGDDGASDTSSMASYDYNGPRLFKQPTTKSNRSIILNAVEYCVFPGAVNREAKHRVLEEIARCEAKHFLILFRDAKCQFRALYWYDPDTEEVVKMYGTGPKQATDRMFDKFYKYNSGGKCFTVIHTKHLSVTIDAFTIHDALWQGKRPSLPSKKDLTLVT